MRWSKNILEERESLDQITTGSMDLNDCVLLALSLHLEHCTLEINQQDGKPLLFRISKQRIRALFEEITTPLDFPLSQTLHPIGTHSICKLPTTYVRQNGCSKDDVDAIGRWKSKYVSSIQR